MISQKPHYVVWIIGQSNQTIHNPTKIHFPPPKKTKIIIQINPNITITNSKKPSLHLILIHSPHPPFLSDLQTERLMPPPASLLAGAVIGLVAAPAITMELFNEAWKKVVLLINPSKIPLCFRKSSSFLPKPTLIFCFSSSIETSHLEVNLNFSFYFQFWLKDRYFKFIEV